ncbi:MAG: ribbon-helix-helix domain-containing protein [Euryarchaeota archaeon]|nr:ribbon-helix-helix domain-containing protein [Euryarchaeota archaeon]MBU4491057.1 ribbon-helix-helix domain-containing protein [Euryarchaeota archaeon]
MIKIKTSVALDENLLKWVDLQIEKKRFANRTHAIEYALQQLVENETHNSASKYQLILHEGKETRYSKGK